MREKRIDFMALWDYYRQQWVIAVSSLISVHWTCETHQGKSIRKNDRSKIISDLRAFRIVSYVRFNDRIHVLWLGPMKYRALAHLWFNHFPFNSDSLECFRYNFPPRLIYLLLVIGQKWCVAVEQNVREGERCREKGDVRDFKLPRHDYFVMFFFSLLSNIVKFHASTSTTCKWINLILFGVFYSSFRSCCCCCCSPQFSISLFSPFWLVVAIKL